MKIKIFKLINFDSDRIDINVRYLDNFYLISFCVKQYFFKLIHKITLDKKFEGIKLIILKLYSY
jgi:hypothetical protein